MWQQCVDTMKARTRDVENRQAAIRALCEQQEQVMAASETNVSKCEEALERIAESRGQDDPDVTALSDQLELLRERMEDFRILETVAKFTAMDASLLPPSMISAISEKLIMPEESWHQVLSRRTLVRRASRGSSGSGDTLLRMHENEHSEQIANSLKALDKDGSGTISKRELIKVLEQITGITKDHIAKLCNEKEIPGTEDSIKSLDFINWLYHK